jgi:hypothetical protein
MQKVVKIISPLKYVNNFKDKELRDYYIYRYAKMAIFISSPAGNFLTSLRPSPTWRGRK